MNKDKIFISKGKKKKKISKKVLSIITEYSDQSTNEKFIRKIYSKAHPTPFGGGVVFSFSQKGDDEPTMIKVDLHPMIDSVHITEITVLEDKGGKGFGDHVMKIITKEADRMKVDLNLNAVPLAHKGKKIPKGKLIRFYKKHGFKVDRGDHMVRLQKQKPIKLSGKMKTIGISEARSDSGKMKLGDLKLGDTVITRVDKMKYKVTRIKANVGEDDTDGFLAVRWIKTRKIWSKKEALIFYNQADKI